MTDTETLPDYRGLFDLTGKTALVTGSCGILGRHFSAGLAAHGAGRSLDLEQTAADHLAAAWRRLTALIAASPAMSRTRRRSRKPSGESKARPAGSTSSGNNAVTKGTLEAMFEPAETYAPETWREHMAINLDGPFT